VLGTYAGIGNIAPGLFSFLLPVALSGIGLAGSYLAWLFFLAVGTGLYAWTGRNAWFFQHRALGLNTDAARTAALEAEGFRVLRFENRAVFDDLDGVLAHIVAHFADDPG